MIRRRFIYSLLAIFLSLNTSPESSQGQDNLCDVLTDHYIEVWHKHQQISLEIQQGRPYFILEKKMELLNLLYKSLVDTAKSIERHHCELPKDFRNKY